MNIGFIAHDEKKVLVQNFCVAYRPILAKHHLFSTGTTGRMIEEVTGLEVSKYLSGKVGGVQQLINQIERDEIDLMIFLCDPMKKLQETYARQVIFNCDANNIPIATNLATAEMLMKSLDRGELEWREVFKKN